MASHGDHRPAPWLFGKWLFGKRLFGNWLFRLWKVYWLTFHLVLKTLARVLPFPQPTLLIGSDSLHSLGDVLQQRGWTRPLLVSDRQLMRLQLPAPLINALAGAGMHCTIFDAVPENPTIASVEAGLRRFQATGCDSLIAIGGGSVMDCAKGIAARAGNPWLPLQWMEGLFKVIGPTPPLTCIPTTAGSGSEATIAAVFTDPTQARKFAIADLKLMPRVTVIDPQLLLTLPPSITAAGGMDALTHAVESFIGRNGNAWSRNKACSALRRIHRSLLNAYRQGDDLPARLDMALAAHEAGEAFTRTNVGYVHAIAHAIGSRYGLPHGLANAIALPPVLRWSQPACKFQLAELARTIALGDAQASDTELATQFIHWVEELNRQLNIPPVVHELQDTDIPVLCRSILQEAHPDYPVPRLMTPSDCASVMREMLEPTR